MHVLERFSMKHKASLITGGSRGLGFAMATALAQAGSDIAIADINPERAEEAAEAIKRDCGVGTIALYCDVTKPDSVQAMADATAEKFGKIDVLLNCAGIVISAPAEDVKYEDWLAVIDTNLTGTFLSCQAVGRYMISQKSGSIVNMSSISGLVVNTPQPQVSYNASKAAVTQLTKSLAAEWAPHNVRVNAIAPGYMKTDMTKKTREAGGEKLARWLSLTPMGRNGEPEELTGTVLYLASDASSYTTGALLVVDGGYTIW